MAIESVHENYTIDFQNTFDSVAQEKEAKMVMSGIITPETMDGEVKAIDRIGKVEAREITGRVVKVQFDDIEHTRRQLSTKRYALTLPVDAADVQDLARDPSGRYAEECVNAFNRLKDRIILTAADANVLTGEGFTTTTSFASDGGRTVDATAAGLTFEKVREIKQKQGAKATGTDYMEKAVLVISDKEQDTMLSETELTSGDFDRLFSRDENGSMVMVLGMDVIQYASESEKPILKVAGGERSCFAFAGNALAWGVHTEPKVEILDMKNEYYETMAVNIVGRMGAVRREGVRVIKVNTTA